jgi:putative ABC transport system ATP-binding protein
VLITHNAPIAQIAHRVLTLADGRIAREQTPARRVAARELVW